MSYFKNFLSDTESLFKNEDALDLEWVPKEIPFREVQQQTVVNTIRPLLNGRNGKNLFVFGDPGVGKTAASRWVLRDLEENTDEVLSVYINCWQKNTSYKVFVEIAHQWGYRFTQNKNTEEVFNVVKNMANKKSAVFVFDEIDKIEDFDFLYSILNDVYKKSVVLITNYKECLSKLEHRVRSRLMPEMLEFRRYSQGEIEKILAQRVQYAFSPGVWGAAEIKIIASEAAKNGDLRSGIFMLRESALLAENEGRKKVALDHVKSAVGKVRAQGISRTTDLEEESRSILEMIEKHSPKRIGDLFTMYKEAGGGNTYKTFQRKIVKLEKAKFINTNKIVGGKDGSTTIISFGAAKKLSDF